MRSLFAAAAALLALVASPALADMRATYRVTAGKTATVVTIEVSDSGAYRVEAPIGGEGASPNVVMFGTPAGEILFAMPSPWGTIVTRNEDLVAVTDPIIEQTVAHDFKVPPEVVGAQLREAGFSTVNGRQGRRFLLEPPANARGGPAPVELVVSADPALAPLLGAMAGALAGMEGSALFKRSAPPFLRQFADLVRTNVLLRAGTFVELTLVETGVVVPGGRFVPPADPMSREELRALLSRAMEAAPAAGRPGAPPFTTTPNGPPQPPLPPDSDKPVFHVEEPPPPPEPD